MPAKKTQTVAQNPFAELFKLPAFDTFGEMPKLPMIDMAELAKAQQKNVAALVDANKIALDGYQAVIDRQTALFDEAVSKVKADLENIKPETLTAEAATAKFAEAQTAVEKAFADAKDIAELAQKANEAAFGVLKARADEVMTEVKEAADKLAA